MIRPSTIRKPPTADDAKTPGDSDFSAGQQLAKLQAQLDLLKAQVRQAQQLSSLGTAATMIAHEVNNLLTPIHAYAASALDTGDVELQRKALAVTLKNVKMLVAMSERVLEISAAKPAKRESVFARAVAQDAVASLCRDLSKDGITLSIDVDASVTAWADRLQLQQVLFNLFLNAREAMAPSRTGRLRVSACRQNDKVVIEVHNTGECIGPELLSHVFDPFETSKAVKRDERTRCSGLGLTLCRDLIEENNGTIAVASEPEAGTTFTIILPASQPAEHCRVSNIDCGA